MADIKYYDVILKPVVTEKSMNDMADKKYTFLVHPEVTKTQVKEAVEKGEIPLVRYQNYLTVLQMIQQRKEKYL